jgi:tetratricopeptide (TPR) repeat protein
MHRITVKHALRSCEELLVQERYEEAGRILDLAASQLEDQRDWQAIRRVHEAMPERVRLTSDGLSCGYARCLVGSRCKDELLGFSEAALRGRSGEVASRLLLERSWALTAEGRHQEAFTSLETALLYLSGHDRGVALRRFGLVAFKMGLPWQEFFAQAKQLLQGRALGLTMLEEGHCLERSARAQEARVLWTNALKYVSNDLFHSAWLQYNIGITAVRDGERDGEQHLLYAEELTRTERALEFRPMVLIGLCTVRRINGEWARAESAALAALKLARDPLTRQQALFDLARTLRLEGRVYEALGRYQQALDVIPNGEAHVSLATCYLTLGEVSRCREALAQVTVVTGFSVWLQAIVLAELARQTGEVESMLKHIEGLPLTLVYVREEVSAWPELFAALRAHGRTVPVPLEHAAQVTVRVEALGVLRVAVNQRPVPFPPTSRAAEILVFLLENGGQATLERLLDALMPNAFGDLERRRARKSLWNAVERLRETLGWQESVQNLAGSAYQLDPRVIWQYDVDDLRRKQASTTRLFLEGLYSEWVLEVRAGLE